MKKFLEKDNKNIIKKLTNLIYIYNRRTKNIKLKFLYRYYCNAIISYKEDTIDTEKKFFLNRLIRKKNRSNNRNKIFENKNLLSSTRDTFIQNSSKIKKIKDIDNEQNNNSVFTFINDIKLFKQIINTKNCSIKNNIKTHKKGKSIIYKLYESNINFTKNNSYHKNISNINNNGLSEYQKKILLNKCRLFSNNTLSTHKKNSNRYDIKLSDYKLINKKNKEDKKSNHIINQIKLKNKLFEKYENIYPKYNIHNINYMTKNIKKEKIIETSFESLSDSKIFDMAKKFIKKNDNINNNEIKDILNHKKYHK